MTAHPDCVSSCVICVQDAKESVIRRCVEAVEARAKKAVHNGKGSIAHALRESADDLRALLSVGP